MKPISGPPRGEVLLEALGADTDFTEAVLGDLAEEYDLRASFDGPTVARRWYYRECLRATPYLLRDWFRNLRWFNVGYFAAVVLGTTVIAKVVDFGLQMTFRTQLEALARSRSLIVLPAVMLLWTIFSGVTSGWVAAGLGRRAPLPSALVFGVIGALAIMSSFQVPLVFRVMNSTLLLTGVLTGGVLQTLGRRPRAD